MENKKQKQKKDDKNIAHILLTGGTIDSYFNPTKDNISIAGS